VTAPAEQARSVSIVIPVRNGAATLEACLRAACAAADDRTEIVVVDDGSDDATAEIAGRFPCRVVRLGAHAGVSRARNQGARAAHGELLLFIDADCLLEPGAIRAAREGYGARVDLVLGGTYTPAPADPGFFGAFQAAFIHHFEMKRAVPDYVAAHAMVIDARLFRRSGGFVEGPVLGIAASVEDVELSHRLRRGGCELAMSPDLLVRHVFRFSLRRSLANAYRKARTWTRYSLGNRDLLADSGTASRELKVHVVLAGAAVLLLAAAGALGGGAAAAAAALLALDLRLHRGLLGAWQRAGGAGFASLAALYYLTLFAAAVGTGAAAGALRHAWDVRPLGRYRSCTPRSGTYRLSS
jgi:glycosyltransferase involved in cell wall biosynthesis